MVIDDATQSAPLGFTPLFDMPDDARFRMLSLRSHPAGYNTYLLMERQRRCCVVGYKDAFVREELLIGFDGHCGTVHERAIGPSITLDKILEHVPYFMELLSINPAHVVFRDILDDHYRSIIN